MQKFLIFISLWFMSLLMMGQQVLPTVTAYGGCWTSTGIPKNSLAAISLAQKMGYEAVYIDATLTADGIPVAVPAGTTDKFLRHAADYAPLRQQINLSEITYADLRKKYVTVSDSVTLRQPVSSLKEILKACKKHKIVPMISIDNATVLRVTKKIMGNKWICLAPNDSIAQVVRACSDCTILVNMDKVTPQEAISRLKTIGGHCGLSTIHPETLTETMCLQLRANGFETHSMQFRPAYEVQATLHGVTQTTSDFTFPYKSTFKPTDQWKVTSLVMPQQEELKKQWENYNHGGLVLRFWFRGAIIVIVNGEKKYSLVSNGDSMQYISTRFTGIAPSIRIIAATDTQMAEMETLLYTFE